MKRMTKMNVNKDYTGFHARVEFDDGSVVGSGKIIFSTSDEARLWAERLQVSDGEDSGEQSSDGRVNNNSATATDPNESETTS